MNIELSSAERDMVYELLQSLRVGYCQSLDKFSHCKHNGLTPYGINTLENHISKLKNMLENIDVLIAKLLATQT